MTRPVFGQMQRERLFKGEGMTIRRRTAAEILMGIGVVCGVTYILINLSGLPVNILRFGGLLLYASIVTISSGLVFYMLARVRRI